MALDGCDVSQSHSNKNVWSPAGQVVGHAGDDLDDIIAVFVMLVLIMIW